MKQIRKPLALLLSAALALSCGSTLALAAGPDSPENCLSIFAQQDKPAVTVTSNILGLADTGNKTSLKKRPCKRPPARVILIFTTTMQTVNG